MMQNGFFDRNGDDIPEMLVFDWNGKKAIFYAESGKLPWASYEEKDWSAYFNEAFCVGIDKNPWNPLRSGWGTYTLMVDRNGDGRFDTTDDFCYRGIDVNGDGEPEAEYYHLFPGEDWCPYSNKLHINFDGAKEMSYLDFANLTYANEQKYGPGVEYFMRVQGSGMFVNSYSAHPDCSWETPIAWYDVNGDGFPEMVMRIGDTANNEIPQSGFLAAGKDYYSGLVSEFELSYELNGNMSKERQHSLDMHMSFTNYEAPTLDYTRYDDKPAFLEIPEALKELHGGLADTRSETVRRYLPYMDGCDISMRDEGWNKVFMMFDEDDDDCRWEEMFSTHEDEIEHCLPGWNQFADQIGDRTEVDHGYKGKGMLYRGAFDGRIHLYGADIGYWDIDYLAAFKGSSDHPFETEGPRPRDGMRYQRVEYTDEDIDGFIDTMTYVTVAFGHEKETRVVDRVVKIDNTVKPTLFDPRAEVTYTGFKMENWDGKPISFEGTPIKAYHTHMKAFYEDICHQMWAEAKKLYDTAAAYGLNTDENADADLKTDYTREELLAMTEYGVPAGYSKHLSANSLREEYNNGYWLREKVFADICKDARLDKAAMEALYYSGKIDALCSYIKEQL